MMASFPNPFGDWSGWETQEVIDLIGEKQYKLRAWSMFAPPAQALTSPTCKEVEMAVSNLCSAEDCDKKTIAKGYCDTHYRRWRKHGATNVGATRAGEVQRYFRDVVLRFEGEDCLIWPFARNPAGYGKVSWDGRLQHSHRLACIVVNGPPPTDQHEAAHSCGNGHLGCCNPRHVSWKTPAENQEDRIAHGTLRRGEDVSTSVLSERQVREIRALKGVQSQKKTAAQFGVSRGCVYGIQRRSRWAWLQD